MPDTLFSCSRTQPVGYRLVVKGKIGDALSGWFNGMQIESSQGEVDSPVTILSVPVADQAALRGLLCRLWDLNLTLLSVCRLDLPACPAGEKEGKQNE